MSSEKAKNLIGRVLISAIFIYAIPGKIINFQRTVEVIIIKNIPPFISPFLLLTAILFLILESILFISVFKQRLGAYILIILIIQTTFIFHLLPFQAKALLMNAGYFCGLILGSYKIKSRSLKDRFKNE